MSNLTCKPNFADRHIKKSEPLKLPIEKGGFFRSSCHSEGLNAPKRCPERSEGTF
jgi:hypothetical protein